MNKEKATAPEAVEEVYTLAELAAAAESAFGTQPEVVVAAMKGAGKDSATKAEAEGLVKNFLNKEVTK